MSRSDTKIPSCGFFRLPQVIALIPISKSAWWEGCRTGRYPKPVKLGPRTRRSSKAWVRTAAMNSDIQQSGSFRRYSERLLPCRSSTEYPRLAKRNLFFRNTKTVK